MPHRHYRKPDRELLTALARANRLLGRMGIEPFCTVDEARDLPDFRVRELLLISEMQFQTAIHAFHGYLG